MLPNPLIAGFNPDPTICRVGADYFVAVSSFEYFPSVPIYHSRDLAEWNLIGHALNRPDQLSMRVTRPGHGVFAPTLRYHDSRFYMATAAVYKHNFEVRGSRSMGFYVSTDNIWDDSCWSAQIYFDTRGIDQDLFFDDDDKTYLCVAKVSSQYVEGESYLEVYGVQVDLATGRSLSQPVMLRRSTQGNGIAEGPHLYKRNGFYYLSVAEGGTDMDHQQWIFRSPNVLGPYSEPEPNLQVNPILFNDKHQELQQTGHADMVEAEDGKWWIVFLGIRPRKNDFAHLGRETFVAPLEWSEDGWPMVNDGKPVGLLPRQAANQVQPRVWKDGFFGKVIDDLNFPLLQTVSAWRLDSDDPIVAGLASPKNQSYTREVFDDVQQVCASRGVTIIPELEAPDHALAITKWRPQIALRGNPTMLNISHPDTIPTVKTIWSTFLPWFYTETVHIGADEYSSEFIPEYNHFVNTMDDFIEETGHRDIRIWAAFPTGDTDDEVHRDVVVQHWFPITDNPLFDFLLKGYRVINSDVATYIVTTDNPYFGTRLNVSRIFHGNPSRGGYYPWVFSPTNRTNNPAPNDPRVVSQIAATWNDRPWSAPTWTAYIGWREGLPALGDKQWGGDLTQDEYNSVFDRLHAPIPEQNLDGWVPTKSSIILHYPFANNTKDTSGNGYDGMNHGCKFVEGALVLDGECYVETPLVRKGLNYSLSFDVYRQRASSGALFTNEDSSFVVDSGAVNNVTFISEGFPITLNYTLPSQVWAHVLLSSDSRDTWVRVDNATTAQTFNTYYGNDTISWGPVAFPAPLTQIGKGFKGLIKKVVVATEPEAAYVSPYPFPNTLFS